jgi:hypothetical protein
MTPSGKPVYLDIGDQAIPAGLIAAPSRAGKTWLACELIRSLQQSCGGYLDIYIFDPKGGAEFHQDIRAIATTVDPLCEPEAASALIKAIRDRASDAFAFKKQHGLATLREGWCKKIPGADHFRPTLIVVDEFARVVQAVKKPSDSIEQVAEDLRQLLKESIRVYPSLGYHTILITQSARAGELTMLDGAQDSILYTIYGRQKAAMADAVGIPELARDEDLGKKGVFYLEHNNRLTKFRTFGPSRRGRGQ